MSVGEAIWRRADEVGAADVGIVGISKNAGKTTVLNALVESAPASVKPLGILSVGVDGEARDLVSGISKPRIIAPAGTFFATASQALAVAQGRIEWVEPTGVGSPLGEVWVARAETDVAVMLAGVRQVSHLLRVKAIMRRHGAVRLLVDGALARQASLHAGVCDGVILAVGAVLGNLSRVERETRFALWKLTLDEIPSTWRSELARDPDFRGVVVASRPPEWRTVDFPDASSFAGDVRGQPQGPQEAFAFFFGGAVTEPALHALAARREPCAVIARSPAHLFVSEANVRDFLRSGHKIFVWSRPELLGIAVNPHAPQGPGLDRRELRAAVSRLSPVPVWDVLGE